MEQKNEILSRSQEVVRTVREKMWTVLAKDTVSQNVRRQWADVVRSAAKKLDAPSLSFVRNQLRKSADGIGKTMAIGARAQTILTSVLLAGATGFDAYTISNEIKRDSSSINIEAQMVPGGKAIAKGIGSVAIFGLRPIDRMVFLVGRAGKPVAEKVAGIVNTIALKREEKRNMNRVYVGTGKA